MYFDLDVKQCEVWDLISDLNDAMNERDSAYDNNVFFMNDFDEYFYNCSCYSVTRKVFYGNFNPNDDYFMFNGYGNLVSLDEFEICDWIVDNLVEYGECLGDDFEPTLVWLSSVMNGFDFDEVMNRSLANK